MALAAAALASSPRVRHLRLPQPQADLVRIEQHSPFPAAATFRVKRRIEDALKRSAELDSQEIRVSVAGGIVTLEGTADSWAARTHAETAAWAAPGVSVVRNELLVLVLRTSP